MSDNNVTLVGNVTREPELRFTNGGQAVTGLGLAVNRRWQSNGEWREQVSFFNVTCWGQLGENVAGSIQKGCRIVVTGRLEQGEYEGKDGEKKTSVDLVADALGPDLRWATCSVERTERTTAIHTAPGAVESDVF